MSTIKLTTAYQLVITSLLVGACLGIISRQVPLTVSTALPVVSAMAVNEAAAHSSAPQLATAAAEQAHLALASERISEPNRSFETTAQTIDRATAVIGTELATLRNAPSLTASVVGQAYAGQKLQIVAHDPTNRWLLVCCHADQLVWIAAQAVVTIGNSEAITTVSTSNLAVQPDAAALAPVSFALATTIVDAAMRQTDSDPRAGSYQLMQQKQHAERIIPRIFVYVSDQLLTDGLEGVPNLGLLVKKDGVILPAPERTHGGAPDFTWPMRVARQRLANLKVEFPLVNPVGHWEIQLVDHLGNPLAPSAHFDFAPNDPNLEMYLHYQKNRS